MQLDERHALLAAADAEPAACGKSIRSKANA